MRVTELPNPLTAQLDTASREAMIVQIGAAERQIFGSREWGPALNDASFLDKLLHLRERVQRALKQDQGRVILMGAGTSGRLALATAARYRSPYGAGHTVGLMAGGPGAFFKAKEGAEDQPQTGAREVKAAAGATADTVWIGITCGLSAAYVAGGLDEAMRQNYDAVSVIGFNPLKEANQRLLPGLNRHFLSLLETMQRYQGGVLLNPVVGPEPITGSTRMKGGSATKIILDCLLCPGDPKIFLELVRQLQALVFKHAQPLAQALEMASKGLLSGMAIAYLAGHEESAAAIMDASECPPTFGATENQLTAFVPGGFGADFQGVSFAGHGYDDYQSWNLGNRLAFRVSSQNLQGHSSNVPVRIPKCHGLLIPDQQVQDFISKAPVALQNNLRFMALKWTLNAFSTGMFVRFGKVYGNQMIDLRISNLKLWDRAIRIVSELAQVSPETAEHYLRHTVASGDHGTLATDQWVRRAAVMERVVPLAILQAKKGMDLGTARLHLQKFPRLREALT